MWRSVNSELGIPNLQNHIYIETWMCRPFFLFAKRDQNVITGTLYLNRIVLIRISIEDSEKKKKQQINGISNSISTWNGANKHTRLFSVCLLVWINQFQIERDGCTCP